MDPLKQPLTELSLQSQAATTHLFSLRAEREWPASARRVLRALHLRESRKFELCWEAYNLLDSQSRDRCFEILKYTGALPVLLDNEMGRALSKVSKWIPTTWVMRPLDKRVITPIVKAAVKPVTALIAELPESPDRDKDARAWREILALAPTRIISLAIRTILVDVALDLWIDTGAADAAAAPHYDISGQPAYGTYCAPPAVPTGQHPFAQFQQALSEASTAASTSAMQEITQAFQPLFTTLENARIHDLADGICYVNDIVKAAHQSVNNLPAGMKEFILAAGGLADLPWDDQERKSMTITAF